MRREDARTSLSSRADASSTASTSSMAPSLLSARIRNLILLRLFGFLFQPRVLFALLQASGRDRIASEHQPDSCSRHQPRASPVPFYNAPGQPQVLSGDLGFLRVTWLGGRSARKRHASRSSLVVAILALHDCMTPGVEGVRLGGYFLGERCRDLVVPLLPITRRLFGLVFASFRHECPSGLVLLDAFCGRMKKRS